MKTRKKATQRPKRKTGKKTTQRKEVSSKVKRTTKVVAKASATRDWRSKMLARLRQVVKKALPGVVEEIKWGDVPTWSYAGIICTGETYKSTVKMTFARGASLPDPTRLFNSSLDGNLRRAIDFHEGDEIDEKALTQLLCAAAAWNEGKGTSR